MANPNETPLPTPPEPPSAASRNPWASAIMWIVIVLILSGSGVFVFKSCLNTPGNALHKVGELAEKLGQQVQRVASAFTQGTVTTTFTSYATSISGSQNFQFATLSQHEIFTRKDE